MANTNRIKERINFCISGELWEQIPKFFEGLHPADIAEVINHAPQAVQNKLFDCIVDEIKPDVLAELTDETEADILEELTDEQISDIVEDMAPDDAADVLGELEKERYEEILELMEDQDSEGVRELLQYAEDSAGGIMTTDFIAVRATMTAQEAIDYIGSLELDEPVYNAYVVDEEGKLTGWIQLWELLKTTNRNHSLNELAKRDAISVHTDTDQEEVARLASKYDLNSLPVLDFRDRLVGRVTVDDILDVMEEEASEDIFKLAGSSDSELEDSSALHACKARLPWLLITLVTGFVSSLILRNFNTHLEVSHIIVLSSFVPVIMAMGGNTGIQSSTLIIRGISLGLSHRKKLRNILSHEIAAGAGMGLICGIAISIYATVIMGQESAAIAPAYLGLTVGLALFSAMTFAAVFGALVPVLLNRMKIDPAVASGPFVTSSNDIVALLIYYGITLLMISTTPLS
jgi:magnesium transporter